MATKKIFGFSKNGRRLALLALIILAAAACTRVALPQGGTEGELTTDQLAETKDAEIQMTLDVLLSAATANVAEVTETPSATPTAEPEASNETLQAAELTEQAEAQEKAEAEGTATPEETATPTITNTPQPTVSACYAHRYVYDETYPDGTRVNPGEKFQKTWRLQNVGTCDWVSGQYQLVFVSGERMGGQTPFTLNYTVPVDGYANFSINLTAPATPGTYRGYWILKTAAGDNIGWGPTSDEAFWVEIVVRGATPAP